jgi:hypothetical protein
MHSRPVTPPNPPPPPSPPSHRWPKTVLLVSHAREFLNATCTDIIHLHSRTLTSYKGGLAGAAAADLPLQGEGLRLAGALAGAPAARQRSGSGWCPCGPPAQRLRLVPLRPSGASAGAPAGAPAAQWSQRRGSGWGRACPGGGCPAAKGGAVHLPTWLAHPPPQATTPPLRGPWVSGCATRRRQRRRRRLSASTCRCVCGVGRRGGGGGGGGGAAVVAGLFACARAGMRAA